MVLHLPDTKDSEKDTKQIHMIKKKSTVNRTALAWMGKVAGRKKWYILLLTFVQMVLGISGVWYAFLMRGIIDAAVERERDRFYNAALLLAGMVVLQIGLRALNRFLEEYTRSALENGFKERLLTVLLTRNYASVTAVHSGEWMNRLTSDTVVAADGLIQILPCAAGMLIRIAAAVFALSAFAPVFARIFIPGGLFVLMLTSGFRKVLKRLHKKIQEADGNLRVFLQERLNSLMIVRTFAQEETTVKEVKTLMGIHRAARMRRNGFANLCSIGFGTAVHGAYAFGAVYCGYGILQGTMTYGTFTAVLQLIGQVQNPFANITGYLPKYYAMIASAERLLEAEGYQEEYQEDRVSEEKIRHFYQNDFVGLGMKNADFTYWSQVKGEGEADFVPEVLSNLNLEIDKGDYVAFSGPSGCGKSTVLKLLMCLYPLDAGERYLRAADRKIPLTCAWRGLFAYVPQGNQLMNGTIREIIAFGEPDDKLEEERMLMALRIACADDFVLKLERGLDTVLGERGAGLSEGQMQRIAIARAIFSERPVLLLDEATSALDETTERQLLCNLRAMTDKTVLIVTHRQAVFSITDKIICFSEKGDGKNV